MLNNRCISPLHHLHEQATTALGEEGNEEYKPSDYVGEEVQWKPPRAKKLATCTIQDADDEAGTVVLSRDGKVYPKPVPFDDVIFPEE